MLAAVSLFERGSSLHRLEVFEWSGRHSAVKRWAALSLGPPVEETMSGTTIVVIVLVVLFVVGMGSLLIASNRPPKDGSEPPQVGKR
jgi:hypothetical protein